MLSGRGLCDGLIIRSERSYRLWRVVVCDQETSQARRLKPLEGCKIQPPMGIVAPGEKKITTLKQGVSESQQPNCAVNVALLVVSSSINIADIIHTPWKRASLLFSSIIEIHGYADPSIDPRIPSKVTWSRLRHKGKPRRSNLE